MGVIMAMDFRSQVELPVAASSNKEAMRKQEFDAGLATKQDKAPTGGANAGKTLGVKDGAWSEVVTTINTSAFLTTNNPNKTATTEGFRLTNTVNANWMTEFGSRGMKVLLVSTDRAVYDDNGVMLRGDLGGVAQYSSYGFVYQAGDGSSQLLFRYTTEGTGGFHGSGTTAPSTTSGAQVNAGVFAIIPNSTSADNKTYGFKNQRVVEIFSGGKSVPVTIAPSSWQNTGNGYEYNHAIANLDASQEVELRLPSPTTRANYNAFTAAKLIISGTGSSPGQITINADTGASAPGTAITVLLKYHEL